MDTTPLLKQSSYSTFSPHDEIHKIQPGGFHKPNGIGNCETNQESASYTTSVESLQENQDSFTEEKPCKIAKFQVTVEPLAFLFLSAVMVQAVVIPNLFLYKVCAVNFNMTESSCNPRNNSKLISEELADKFQKHVSILNIYGTFIDHIPAMFLIQYLLPWSDIHGRKPLMILSVIGNVITTLLDILVYYAKSYTAEYILLATVPMSLVGGKATFTVAATRYIMDITTTEERTWRLGVLSGMMAVATPIASLSSGFVYEYGDLIAVWITSLVLHVCVFFYIIFGISDSRGYRCDFKKMVTENDSSCAQTKPSQSKEGNNFFSKNFLGMFRNLMKNFKETFKRRKQHQTLGITLMLAMMCVILFSDSAASFVSYLYTRKVFGWDTSEWAFYLTISSSISVFGTLVVFPIVSGYFQLTDNTITVLSLVSLIAMNLTTLSFRSPLIFRIAAIGNLFGATAKTVILSIFSKMFNKEELSSALSVLSSLEAFVPIVSSPTTNLLYQATVVFFPGCIFLYRSCGYLLVLILLGILNFIKRSDEQREV